jgi:hypothetical protein
MAGSIVSLIRSPIVSRTPLLGLAFEVAPRGVYGMLRISRGYGGPLVRLRRNSDSAERDFRATSSGELDTAAVAAWIGLGGKVVTWYDQTGQGNHLTQATATDQPDYNAATQFGGRPSIKFNRTSASDGTKLAHAGDVGNFSGNLSLCFAYEPNAINVGIQTLMTKAGGGAAAGEFALNVQNTSGKLYLDRPNIEAGVVTTAGLTVGQNQMVGIDVNGTSVQHFKNAAANGTDTLATGTATARAFQVGAGDFSGGTQQDPCRGYMRALILWDSLATADREAAQTYIAARSSITLS